MARVFISYRRRDNPYVAGILRDALIERFGSDEVFYDLDNIPFGVDFRQHIADAVGSCDVLVVVIGDQWLQLKNDQGQRRLDDPLDFVRLEIESALKRGIPIVPVLVEDARMPAASELPDSIKEMAYRNAAEVRAGRDQHSQVDRLVSGLIAFLGDDTSQAQSKGAAVFSETSGGSGTPGELNDLTRFRAPERELPFAKRMDAEDDALKRRVAESSSGSARTTSSTQDAGLGHILSRARVQRWLVVGAGVLILGGLAAVLIGRGYGRNPDNPRQRPSSGTTAGNVAAGQYNEAAAQTARAIATQLSKRNVSAARQHFHPSLAQNLSAQTMNEVWDAVVSQVGEVTEIGKVTNTQVGVADVMEIRCATTGGSVKITVAFQPGTTTVTGLWVLPEPRPGGSP